MSIVPPTRPSLLIRVRDAGDSDAWQQFEAAYGELVLRYCRRRGLQLADAEDIRQIVLTKLARSLRRFDYDPARGRFRDYLGQCVRGAIATEFSRHKVASDAVSIQEGDAVLADGEALWHEEWIQHHYRRAARILRATCDEQTLAVFDEVLAGRPYDEIARQYGMSEAAVRKVKQRVRDRLQQLIAKQIQDEELPGANNGVSRP